MDMGKTYRTDFLFSTPSFLEGFASVADIAGAGLVFNESPTGNEADVLAIQADFGVVGQDIRSAMSNEQKNA
jgi:hypothetical protein